MLGLRSCIFQAENVREVADWYEKVLDKKPYFEADAYIGFDVWGYELGIFYRDAEYIQKGNNVEIYWGVDDIEAEFQRLQTLWASIHESPTEVGGGIIMASVLDPFGNVFGIIYNPLFQSNK